MNRLTALCAAALLSLACLFWPSAAKANVVCSLTTQQISFGGSLSATGAVGYTCTSFDATPTSFTICSALGFASWPGSNAQPMMFGNTGGQLAFNVYTDPGHTTLWYNSILTQPVTVAPSATVNGSLTFYGLIPAGQGAPAGDYSAYFYNTSLGIAQSGSCLEHAAGFDGTNNAVTATATIGNNCTVSAGNVALGTVAATATNLAGSATIAITCPNGTPYYVGLAPSNGNSAGQGTLTGTGGNTDHPGYQLRSSPGSGGTIWGNTATTNSVGNGVAGTGNGAAQNTTVYVTVPSANYQPDSYSDTVTVNVNY